MHQEDLPLDLKKILEIEHSIDLSNTELSFEDAIDEFMNHEKENEEDGVDFERVDEKSKKDKEFLEDIGYTTQLPLDGFKKFKTIESMKDEHQVTRNENGEWYFTLSVNGALDRFGPYKNKVKAYEAHDLLAWRCGADESKMFLGPPPGRNYLARFGKERRYNIQRRMGNTDDEQLRRDCKIETFGTSRFKGLSWNVKRKTWTSTASVNLKSHFLGRYVYEEDAARAYNDYMKGIMDLDRLNVCIPHVGEKTKYPKGYATGQCRRRKFKTQLD